MTSLDTIAAHVEMLIERSEELKEELHALRAEVHSLRVDVEVFKARWAMIAVVASSAISGVIGLAFKLIG